MTGATTIVPGFGLGLVASGKRTIAAGNEYDKYFDLCEVDDQETERGDGDVFLTLRIMASIVRNTLNQTKELAEKEFKGYSRTETARRIWNFLYKHVQYKKDNPLREQLRRPARTWTDRRTGVDCDCYTIFISSILTNLRIPHAFRMAKYDGDWQHVYVVVPKTGNSIGKDRSSYLVIDPVVNQFNYETPPSDKHNHSMKITELSGVGACATKPTIDRLRRFVDREVVVQYGMVPTSSFLKTNDIPFQSAVNPESDAGVLVINTTAGPKNLPTIITPGQAQQLKDGISYPVPAIPPAAAAAALAPPSVSTPAAAESPTVTASADDLGKISWAPLIIAGLVGVAVLSSKKKAATVSLTGPPKRLPTLHI